VEEREGGEAIEEVGKLAEKVADAIRSMKTADERVFLALVAVVAIIEKSQLTLAEQAAVVKMVELFFTWGAKEVYDRYTPPLGVM